MVNETKNIDVTERFSGRVKHYIASRPEYPHDLTKKIIQISALDNNSLIADMGMGTGISAIPFLNANIKVIGVEPNEAMYQAAVNSLSNYSNFSALCETAQNTSIAENGIDAIICAQAFHWMKLDETKAEWKRILKPQGEVFIYWNDRSIKSNQFLEVYEDFLQMFAIDYQQVDHKQFQNVNYLEKLFGEKPKIQNFQNEQKLNFDGLLSRVLSSSYMPDENHSEFEYMKYVLRKIFNRFQQDDFVTIEYNTILYYGKIKA